MNLFRPKPKTETVVKIVERDPFRCTVQEWRSNKELVTIAKGMLNNKAVRQMLDTIRNSQLGLFAVDSGLGGDQRSVHLARAEGYGMCLNDLESLATYAAIEEPIEADFAKENWGGLQQ